MTFGELIRSKRSRREETLKQMAKAIQCSEGFARHIEASKTVPVSPRLVLALSKHYRIPVKKLETLVARRNRVGKLYYQKRRRQA